MGGAMTPPVQLFANVAAIPGVVPDNGIVRHGGTTGRRIKGSIVTISDGGVLDNVAGINDVTATELAQLANIDSTVIGTSQWGYLGALDQALATTNSPTFAGVTVSGLTASRLVTTGAGSALASVSDLTSWLAGTANRVTVTSDGDGTATVSLTDSVSGLTSVSATTLTDGTFSTTAGAFTGVASIATPSSITMADAGWIGNAVDGPRIVFDTTSDHIELLGGKVGINTTSPGKNLEIKDAVNGATLRLNNAAASYWDIRRDSATGNLVISDDGLGDVFAISQVTGGVGIGTTTPGYKLEVAGNILVQSTSKTYWRDSAISISSPADSIMALESDGYVRVGTGTTAVALGANGDFLVSGKLETLGRVYVGSYLNIGSTTTALTDIVIQNVGVSRYLWREGGAGAYGGVIANFTYQQAMFAVNANTGNQMLLTDYDNAAKDHDHAAQPTPTLFWEGGDPDVSNNLWGSAAHDGTGLLFSTGANTGVGTTPATVDNYIKFAPRGTARVTIDGSGYTTFGAGTTSHALGAAGDVLVSGKLEVDGTAHFDGNATFYSGTVGIGVNDATRGALSLYGDNDTGGGYLRLYNAANDDTTADYYDIVADEYLAFTYGATTALAITNTGNVAIGATSATSKLDVAGDVEIGSANAFYLGDPTTNGSYRAIRSGDDLLFERREAGSWVTKFTVYAV